MKNMRVKRMNKYTVWTLISLLVGFSLMGCVNNPAKEADDFNLQAKTYGKLIRWRAFDDASQYNQPREGELPKPDMKFLDEIKVTKYEIKSLIISEEGDEAVVIAEITYYHERVNDVKTIEDQQVWWKNEETGQWLVDGGLPKFDP